MQRHEDEVNIEVTIRVPRSFARAFLAAYTGNDDDLLLVAERAINDRVRDEVIAGETLAGAQVEIDTLSRDWADSLRAIARQEERDLATYGPYAG